MTKYPMTKVIRHWVFRHSSFSGFSLYRRPLALHVFDRLQLRTDVQDVVHLERVRLRAAGADGQVPRPEAEDPVAEQVVAVLLDGHALRVVGRLAGPDLRTHPQLARRENHVGLPVEE